MVGLLRAHINVKVLQAAAELRGVDCAVVVRVKGLEDGEHVHVTLTLGVPDEALELVEGLVRLVVRGALHLRRVLQEIADVHVVHGPAQLAHDLLDARAAEAVQLAERRAELAHLDAAGPAAVGLLQPAAQLHRADGVLDNAEVLLNRRKGGALRRRHLAGGRAADGLQQQPEVHGRLGRARLHREDGAEVPKLPGPDARARGAQARAELRAGHHVRVAGRGVQQRGAERFHVRGVPYLAERRPEQRDLGPQVVQQAVEADLAGPLLVQLGDHGHDHLGAELHVELAQRGLGVPEAQPAGAAAVLRLEDVRRLGHELLQGSALRGHVRQHHLHRAVVIAGRGFLHAERPREGDVVHAAGRAAELAQQLPRVGPAAGEVQALQAAAQLVHADVPAEVLVEAVEGRGDAADAVLLRLLHDPPQVLEEVRHAVRLRHGRLRRVVLPRAPGAPHAALLTGGLGGAAGEGDDAAHVDAAVLVRGEARDHPRELLLLQPHARAGEGPLEGAVADGAAAGAAHVVLLLLEQLLQQRGAHLGAAQVPRELARHVRVVRVANEDEELRVRDAAVAVEVHAPEELVLQLRAAAAHALQQPQAVGEGGLVEVALAVHVEVVEGLAQLAGHPVVEAQAHELPELLLEAPLVAVPRAARVPRREEVRRQRVQHVQVRDAGAVAAREAVDERVLLRLREVAEHGVQRRAHLVRGQQTAELVVPALEGQPVVHALAHRRADRVAEALQGAAAPRRPAGRAGAQREAEPRVRRAAGAAQRVEELAVRDLPGAPGVRVPDLQRLARLQADADGLQRALEGAALDAAAVARVLPLQRGAQRVAGGVQAAQLAPHVGEERRQRLRRLQRDRRVEEVAPGDAAGAVAVGLRDGARLALHHGVADVGHRVHELLRG